jgi:thiamine-monophosphate kinase
MGPSRSVRSTRRRASTLRLSDVGEQRWIARLLRRHAPGRRTLVGPGDDAAALATPRRPVLLTIDSLVEGVHFRLAWESPEALGRRALRVNLSDIAAMGGRPLAALVGVEAPPRLPVRVLDGVARGLNADARRWDLDVVGGNLTSGPRLALTVTVLGAAVGPLVTRRAARAGDDVWITGTIGGSGTAVRALRAGRRVRRPPVPVRLGAAWLLAPAVHAMIDVSDGLLQDLGHVCRASGVAADVDAGALPVAGACRRALGAEAPRFAATAGEDYELLVTAPPRRRRALARLASRLGCRLTRIGRIVAGPPAVRLLDVGGRAVPVRRAGFDHFR